MSGAGDVERAVGEWVEKAEHDLVTAEQTLKLRRRCPFDTVCFHAQQCAEKYLFTSRMARPYTWLESAGGLASAQPRRPGAADARYEFGILSPGTPEYIVTNLLAV